MNRNFQRRDLGSLHNLASWLTSRKRFRGLRDCEASVAEIAKGNVSPLWFKPKFQVRDGRLSTLLPTIRQQTKAEFSSDVSDQSIAFAKKHGLFGMQSSQKEGGLDMDHCQTACVYEELCFNIPLAMILIAHNCWTVDSLKRMVNGQPLYGSLMKDLNQGKLIGALCGAEQVCDFHTISTVHQDGHLTGSKSWVTNADRANVFLTAARDGGRDDNELLLCLVNRSDCEVRKRRTFADIGVNFCDVQFKKSPIRQDTGNLSKNVDGYNLLVEQMLAGRRHVLSLCSGLAKVLMDHIVDQLREQDDRFDRSSVDKRLNWLKVARDVFKIESMAFYLGSLHDQKDNDNTMAIEFSLASIRAVDAVRDLLRTFGLLLDSLSMRTDVSCFQQLRDQVEILSHFGWSEPVTEIYCGYEILRSVARDESVMLTNILNMSDYHEMVELATERDCLIRGQAVFLYDLWEHLKGIPFVQSHWIETAMVQLNSASKVLLLRDGPDSLDETKGGQQPDVMRVARMAEHLLVMISSANRVKHAVSLKQPEAELSLFLAGEVIKHEHTQCTMIYNEVVGRDYPLSEEPCRIGRRMLQNGQTSLSDPIERLF